ncbi:hypothetical protein [Streptomyces liliifuscus]|uniref:Uncharacterized protein n=1 Tax=Streptomyces liliifuscus TaxID=2797636 RepID=A0A7T7L222_9ACTN|nr:hypothetical protein [Streptomyces liliifuscus]QQM45009.1 hypothetical protein JEQ17_40130 [Streptomyces liliifuscus]
MAAEDERPDTPRRPHVALEAHECKQRAEDHYKRMDERLVWAVLAVAAELHLIRKEKRRAR